MTSIKHVSLKNVGETGVYINIANSSRAVIGYSNFDSIGLLYGDMSSPPKSAGIFLDSDSSSISDVFINNVNMRSVSVPLIRMTGQSRSLQLHNNSFAGNHIRTGSEVLLLTSAVSVSDLSSNIVIDTIATKTSRFLSLSGPNVHIRNSFLNNNTCDKCNSLVYSQDSLSVMNSVFSENNMTLNPLFLIIWSSSYLSIHNSFVYNQICDSQNKCPKEVSASSYNVSYTYWNTPVDADVADRLSPNSDTDRFLPILERPPDIYGLTSFTCNSYEIAFGGVCWFISPGYVPCETAKEICRAKSTSLADLSVFQSYSTDISHMAGGNSIWVSDTISGDCLSFTQTDGKTGYLATKQKLNSVVCARSATNTCPSSCSAPRGVCNGFLCACESKWSGWDCLTPECPRNCSGNGRCVGGECQCESGWYGEACTFSLCPIYSDCISCTKAPNCGWCDELGKCLPGSAYGPTGNLTSCQNFFYYGCLTADDSLGCSQSISKLNCVERFCQNHTNENDFACMRCRDIQRCFNDAVDNTTCRLWDEDKCPGGEIAPDYSDESRVETIQVKSGVEVIRSGDELLFKCSFRQEDNSVLTVVASRGNRWDLVNKTILSDQAGGLLVKTGDLLRLGQWSFLAADEASLADVIAYADFKVNSTGVTHGNIIESSLADDSMLELLKDLAAEQQELFVDIQNISIVYKLTGKGVLNSAANTTAYSLVLAIPKSNRLDNLVGRVVFANGTYSYLETVSTVDQISDSLQLVSTSLREFSSADLRLKSRDIRNANDQKFICGGGTLWNGIAAYSLNETIEYGDVVVGRKSGSFAIQVVDVQEGDDFQFIIGWPLVDISSNGTFDTLHSVAERATVSTNIVSIHKSFDCGRYFGGLVNCKANVGVESTATLEVNLGLSLVSPYVTGHIGLKLSSTADLSMDISSDRISFSKFISERPYTSSPSIFEVKILGVSLRLRTTTFVDYRIRVSVRSAIGAILNSRANLKHSVTATVSSTSIGPSKQSLSTSYSNNFHLKPLSQTVTSDNVNVNGYVAVGIRSEFPYNGDLFQLLSKLADKLPPDLAQLAKDQLRGAKIAVSIEVEIGAQVSGTGTICGCQSKLGSCSDNPETEPNSLQLRVGPDVAATVGGQFKSHSTSKTFRSYSDAYNRQWCEGPAIKVCSQTETDQCGCECPDGTKGLRRSDGFCDCPCDCGCTQCDGTRYRDMSVWGLCDCDCDDGKCCERGDYPQCQPDKPDPPVDDGIAPACPSNRTGPNCDQPDCSMANNCNGNGVCVLTKFHAQCVCDRNFIGNDCGTRRPAGHGDPHMSSLDGFYYDFMGLGEYWYCRAKQFQLDIQSRFFKDLRWNASYIGGILVRLRDVKVSVMTNNSDPLHSIPTWRVNDQLKSDLSLSLSLSGGSATLTADNDQISLEFQSGESFSWTVVRRPYAQWLEFSYSLPFSYDGKTEGFCGDGDGDVNNDFTGPNGILYSNSWDFGYSWKVSADESLYHRDDIMDERYFDKPGDPARLDPAKVNESYLYPNAAEACEAQHLSLAILTDMCILDVVVTGDLQNANQDALKASSCPTSCSGRGKCLNDSICECISGWSGAACNERLCSPGCSEFGRCIDGFCRCQLGYEGLDCAKLADCTSLLNCTDPLHGSCVATGVCQCNGGFAGADCSQTANCTSLNGCSGRGHCVDNEKCLCDVGYKGRTCESFSCEKLNRCSGHGRCDGFDVCVCNEGYAGLSCLQFACVNDCSHNGRCVGPNQCNCHAGYSGLDCSLETHCVSLNSCTYQGACMLVKDENNITSEACRCFTGFYGLECEEIDCSEVNDCSGRGKCKEPNFCQCFDGYTGLDCGSFTCLNQSNCFSNGNCTAVNKCECNEGWGGLDCSIPACANCSSLTGRCIAPNRCQCLQGFTGIDCSTPIVPNNLYTPEFTELSYNLTISTEIKVGSAVVLPRATDKDTGDAAKISYSLVSWDDWANHFFIVSETTGLITVASSLANVTDVDKILEVSASDRGYPVRSATASVVIRIRSPKCSKSLRVSPSARISHSKIDISLAILTVATTDAVAVASVVYRFTDFYASQGSAKYFRINNSTGEIFILDSSIPSNRYYVGIEAVQMDLPCTATSTADISIIPNVDPITTEVPATTIIPTASAKDKRNDKNTSKG